MSLSLDLAATTGHLAIIRVTCRHDHDVATQIEGLCTAGERDAAAADEPTAGVRQALEAAASRIATVVIVTNNSPECAMDFLAANQLSHLLQDVIGRGPRRIDDMKLAPTMLLTTTRQHPGSAVMDGDSVSDITAAGGLPECPPSASPGMTSVPRNSIKQERG